MNIDDYQKAVERTLLEKPEVMPDYVQWAILYNAMIQAIEACAVVEKLKKQICHQQGLDFEYATEAIKKFVKPFPNELSPEDYMIVWNLAGLLGESGELAKHCMYHIGMGTLDESKPETTKESGDVEWYWAALMKKLGLVPSEVLNYNVAKLMARYPNGFNIKDSTNRDGMAG